MPVSIAIVRSEDGVISPAEPYPAETVRVVFTGREYLCYLPGEEAPELLPIPEPQPEPEWLEFRLAMMMDNGYNRIAEAVHAVKPLLQQRLEAAIGFAEPHLPTVQMLWAGWVAIAPPAAEEIAQFQAIALAAHVPIRFGADGAIEL